MIKPVFRFYGHRQRRGFSAQPRWPETTLRIAVRATIIMATFTGAPMGGFLAARSLRAAGKVRLGPMILSAAACPVGSGVGVAWCATGIAAISGGAADFVRRARQPLCGASTSAGAEQMPRRHRARPSGSYAV